MASSIPVQYQYSVHADVPATLSGIAWSCGTKPQKGECQFVATCPEGPSHRLWPADEINPAFSLCLARARIQQAYFIQIQARGTLILLPFRNIIEAKQAKDTLKRK
eukprot:5223963-Pleurochrysis_carterae.AAC.1